jgi:hypothetical protein
MFKHGIDQEALVRKFAQASTKQGDALREAVQKSTLQALQSRELTLVHIKQVLDTVTQAASTGAAANALGSLDVEGLLAKAFAGMDAALVQAVQANRKALQQLVDQGVSVRETQVKKVLSDIDKMEDALFAAVRKASAGAGAGASLQAPWAKVLGAAHGKSTDTGALASATIEQMLNGAQEGLRSSRAIGLKASQAMLDSYSTLVSGVLIGMSDALQAAPAKPAASRAKKG